MTAASPCSSCFRNSTRREWIRRLAMSCSAYAGLSGSFTPPAASGAILNLHERLRINIDAFPSLALNSGSVKITYNRELTSILINRESDTDFFAMDPTCTHMGCPVDRYSIATNTITCPCHGSQFDIRGQVVGGPALNNLNTYATQFEGTSTLNIEISGFVHRIHEIAVHANLPASVTRMRLSFPTMPGSQYQVRHSPDLSTPFSTTLFATTESGIANQSLFDGTGAPATLYVDAPGGAGFFTLELMVYEVF